MGNSLSVISNTYFKSTFEDGLIYISGLPLPDPDKGPYLFKNCDIHPCLDEEMEKYIEQGSRVE